MFKFAFMILAWSGFMHPNSEAKEAAKEKTAAPKYEVEVLSEAPRVILYRNFLSLEECDHLIKQATPEMKRSTVVNPDATESKIDQARTSEGMFFGGRGVDPVITRIEERIAALTDTPVDHGEAIQVLHYTPGAEYKPHYDYFDPATVGGAAAYNRGGQRLITFIMYLYDTEEGGETIFPKANVAVKPVKGNAVLFYNCLPNGQEDTLTLHGGAPVIKGDKWIATKWIRKGVFN